MTRLASPRVLLGAVDRLPALAAASQRLRRRATADGGTAELVLVVESDVALSIAALRLANHGPRRGTVGSVAEAVGVAGPARLRALADRVPSADPLSHAPGDARRQHFRLHCLTVQATMDRVAVATSEQQRDELLTAALLHDIGKLALGDEQDDVSLLDLDAHADEPEARLQSERDRFGTDHAELGGQLARRLGLPDRLAQIIAEHHSATGGCAGMVRLADMLTLYAQGRLVDLSVLVELSGAVGLTREQLAQLLYELPQPVTITRRTLQSCPLSARELEVLERLAAGEVYKQIGAGLGLSPSTVRSHLHRIYTRIGVADRTQAVLLARDSGWI
jgi:putative nucleotidyltransferase with HDIG domain